MPGALPPTVGAHRPPFPFHTVAGSLIEFVPVFTVEYPLFVTTLIKAQLQQRVFFIYHVY
jgi:hypothetical protein